MTLNVIEHAGIYLKKKTQSAEYARILNVPIAVHSIVSLYKLLSSYRDRETYSEHCQTFKMERFAKRIMPECRCATRLFSGQWGWGGWGVSGTRALRYRFRHKHQKKRSRRVIFWSLFSQILLKLHLNGKFNPKMNTVRAILSKIKTLFSISKKAEEASPLPPSCAPVSVTE